MSENVTRETVERFFAQLDLKKLLEEYIEDQQAKDMGFITTPSMLRRMEEKSRKEREAELIGRELVQFNGSLFP